MCFPEQSLAYFYMSDQELTPLQIKLVNIIQDKFQKPSATEGRNILKRTEMVLSDVLQLWPEGDFDESDIEACLIYLQFDFVNSTTGGIVWLIRSND